MARVESHLLRRSLSIAYSTLRCTQQLLGVHGGEIPDAVLWGGVGQVTVLRRGERDLKLSTMWPSCLQNGKTPGSVT